MIKKSKPAPASQELKELPVRDAGVRDHRSYVFYGRSGTGKTTIAATFPKPALLVDIKDSGDDSVTGTPGLKVLDVKSWDDFELGYWWLYRNPTKYKTVIFDTVSQLQQLAILKVLQQRHNGAEPTVKGRTVLSASDWGVMTKQGWGDVASLMKMWITNLRDLPMEVVFIAQDRTFNFGEEDASEGMLDPEVGPALSPSIAKHLNASVHMIGNTFIRRRFVVKEIREGRKIKKKEVARTEFCLRIGPNPVYITKIRKPKHIIPPSLLVNPEYKELVKLIKGE